MDGKKGRGASVETPPDTPPELVSGYEVDLHNLIHEDERMYGSKYLCISTANSNR